MSIELRFQPNDLEVLESGELFVSGYVNKTNERSHVLGSTQKFVEKIKKGAFKKALEIRDKDIDFLAEHDSKKILSSTRNNSLLLREDDFGLYMEATITPTSWGKDTYTLIKSGILRNMSFGFKVLKDSWKRAENNLLERTIEQLQLFEVSVVKDPAYSQTVIEARGIEILNDVEIPYELDEEKQMEQVINMIQELSKKFDLVASNVAELTTAQKQVEVREKEAEEVEILEPVTDSVKEPVAEVVEEAAEAVVEVVEEEPIETTQTIVEEEAEEIIEPAEEIVEVVEEVIEIEPETEVAEEAPVEQRSKDEEYETILTKLNQLKQGEN